MRRGVWTVVLTGVAALLAGCGGGSSPSAGTAPVTPGSHEAAAAKVQAVAYISGTPILTSSYTHWLGVERALGAGADASHKALSFLITSSWILGEAAARHLDVSDAEAHRRLQKLEHSSFPKAGELQKYLQRSHQSSGDLLARVRVELLKQRLAGVITAGATGASAHRRLASFEERFHDHWKSLTNCLPRYLMEDCRQYSGGGEPELARPSRAASAQARTPPAGTGATVPDGGVYTTPGSLAIFSPAFGENGAIPSRYTCDGAGISPPLRWEHVPAHAAELVLFVIDDSSYHANAGIRWIVGGIDPSTSGVAAGKLPRGAIVGTNEAGQAAYGPICPTAGHTDKIEFELYALKKTISLSPDFKPDVAEQEYAAGRDIIGAPAITYAVYHRP